MSNLSKYKIITIIRYFAEALFFPFISLFLSNNGLSTTEIGLIIGLIPLAGLLMNPLYSYLCKTPKVTKTVLAIMSTIEAILITIFVFVSGFVPSLILVVLISITSSSNFGLIDSLLTLVAKQNNKPFSSIRVFGSSSYMVGAFLAGYITKWTSYRVLFIIAAVFFVVVTLVYLLTQSPQMVSDENDINNTRFIDIIKNKSFVLYLLFYVLLIGTMQIGDDYFSLYLQSRGGDASDYSNVMFGFIIVEIMVMLVLSKWGDKLKRKLKLFFVATIVLILRLIIQSIPSIPQWALIVSQLTRGITWGIALYLSTSYVLKLLEDKAATRGIMLIMMINQIFTSLFKLVGGYVIDLIGYAHFYLILVGTSIISLGVFLIYYFVIYKRIE